MYLVIILFLFRNLNAKLKFKKHAAEQMGIALPPTPPNMFIYSSDRNVIFDFFGIVFKKFISRLWGFNRIYFN